MVLYLYLTTVNIAVDAATSGQTCFDYENYDTSKLQQRLLSKRASIHNDARILKKKKKKNKQQPTAGE